MPRLIGSGDKTKYVNFRTRQENYDRMIKIGDRLGLNRSRVYRAAEELFIKTHFKMSVSLKLKKRMP